MFGRFVGRLRAWLRTVLVGGSQYIINTIVVGLWHAITGWGKPSNPDETYSSRVGRNALKGKRWALIAEKIIDGLLGKGHCRESIETFDR